MIDSSHMAVSYFVSEKLMIHKNRNYLKQSMFAKNITENERTKSKLLHRRHL